MAGGRSVGAGIGYILGYHSLGQALILAIDPLKPLGGVLFGVIGSFVGPLVGLVVGIQLAASKAAESKDCQSGQETANIERKNVHENKREAAS